MDSEKIESDRCIVQELAIRRKCVVSNNKSVSSEILYKVSINEFTWLSDSAKLSAATLRACQSSKANRPKQENLPKKAG